MTDDDRGTGQELGTESLFEERWRELGWGDAVASEVARDAEHTTKAEPDQETQRDEGAEAGDATGTRAPDIRADRTTGSIAATEPLGPLGPAGSSTALGPSVTEPEPDAGGASRTTRRVGTGALHPSSPEAVAGARPTPPPVSTLFDQEGAPQPALRQTVSAATSRPVLASVAAVPWPPVVRSAAPATTAAKTPDGRDTRNGALPDTAGTTVAQPSATAPGSARADASPLTEELDPSPLPRMAPPADTAVPAAPPWRVGAPPPAVPAAPAPTAPAAAAALAAAPTGRSGAPTALTAPTAPTAPSAPTAPVRSGPRREIARLGELAARDLDRRAINLNARRIGKLEPEWDTWHRIRSLIVLVVIVAIVAAAVAAVFSIAVEILGAAANHAISKSAGS